MIMDKIMFNYFAPNDFVLNFLDELLYCTE